MNDESLRAKIRNLSKDKNIPPHLLMQNYFLERLLFRISVSQYNDNIILKGGLLIAALIGINKRTTMDMDTAIKSYPVQEEKIVDMINALLIIEAEDDIKFDFIDIKEIRQQDDYFGYRVRIVAHFGRINQNLSIDISTGDVITPEQITYSYKGLIDDEIIPIKTYNIESIIAEKTETIISRGTLSTRMRDFYDVFMLWKLKKDEVNNEVLKNAIINTFKNRGTFDLFEMRFKIIGQIQSSNQMRELWKKYLSKNSYVDRISFDDVLMAILELIEIFQ